MVYFTSIPSDSAGLESNFQADFRSQSLSDTPGTGLAELLLDIEEYDDEYYGFRVAIPSGWKKIMAEQLEQPDEVVLEPGYSIGFESPNQGHGDTFADYIMIEILPGNDSGLFLSDDGVRHSILVDGKPGWFDKLELDSSDAGLKDVNLTVYQAEIKGLGYTVGFYAIGEPDRDALMSAAFEVMLRTFTFTMEPFATA